MHDWTCDTQCLEELVFVISLEPRHQQAAYASMLQGNHALVFDNGIIFPKPIYHRLREGIAETTHLTSLIINLLNEHISGIASWIDALLWHIPPSSRALNFQVKV